MRSPTLAAALPLLLGLTSSPAVADDACLTGESTTGDRRALAALRESLEATCPCAAYDGSPGFDRAAYRNCARGVVRTAVDTGTLRQRCRGRGSRVYRTATCGSDRVACGSAKASAAKHAASCRVKPASACGDSGSVERTICGADIFCEDVTEWTAGTCVDTRARVSAVGVSIFTRTKPGYVDPMTMRTLDAVVWYPTAASGSDDPVYKAILDAPLDGSAGPYPLLMFSHGACGTATQSTFLLPLIASYGYVVASVPHPGNTLADYPYCLTQESLVASAYERPPDIIFMTDELLAANGDALSPFFGSIDPSRIGMSGHSFGGFTTYFVTAYDSRFKTALIMAGGVPQMVSSTAVPSMHMLGDIDSITLGGTSNVERSQAYLDSTRPKFFVDIRDAGHFAFSDGCFPSVPDCNPPVTLTQDEAHELVLRWAVPFLQRYLKGDPPYAAFLVPPAPPGVDFDAQP